jgi:cyanuric acid amidohydrolase
MKVKIIRFPTDGPGDTRFLDSLISSNQIDPKEVTALLCKIEGTGTTNDFSRDLAYERYTAYFSEKLSLSPSEVRKQVSFIFSSGCEGVISPHGYLFLITDKKYRVPGREKRLTIGIAKSRELQAEETGSMKQVALVAEAVKKALEDAFIEDPNDVHVVFVKSPVFFGASLRKEHFQEVQTSVKVRASSTSNTRAASALGVALALGEIPEDKIEEHSIGRDFNLYSNVAITFSGVELRHCEVILLGNTDFAQSDFKIAHGSLVDLLDVEGIKEVLRKAGLDFTCCLDEKNRSRVAALFIKVGIDPSGRVRGRRTAVLDSDLNFTRNLRAAASGIAASLLGDTEVFVSAGAEHQGPPGGGIVSAIVRV